MSGLRQVKKALISLSDKSGAVDFARALTDLGITIISTGGTAKTLRESGIQVTDVSEVTGFPEMMDGRVKTLHPKIHGAFLALRDNTEHLEAMQMHGIEPIDLVVINLYPFEQTIAKEGVSVDEAVENIDIGGPAMIRSASKNWRDVAVVTDPKLYDGIVDELRENDCSLSLNTRQRLAALAYTRTASYDLAISSYLAKQLSHDDLEFLEPLNPLGDLVFIESEDIDTMSEPGTVVTGLLSPPDGRPVATALGSDLSQGLPSSVTIELAKIADLRYGENPHQKAALYDTSESDGIAKAEQLHGKEMSFNNYVDAEAAWNLVQDFDELAVTIIKHTNPSGVGIGQTNEEAYRRALSTDPVSAFGGIVAFNRIVDAEVAKSVNEVFTEVVIAPDYDADAVEIFKTKKNLRVLKLNESAFRIPHSAIEYRQISGGMLVQTKDDYRISAADLKTVSKKQPTDDDIKAMLLAWKVCKHVKSNAIVFSNDKQTIGVGSGQMNRVDSLRIAAIRAERFDLPVKGSALASDAFFPFRDNVDEAAKLGVSTIIQPGGSIKDDESIAAADEHGIIMIFTGIRHFKH
jgi:phosphoribosylaminoimidazolecarboxamide formyltransferase / IMP cyclohydrolase